MPKRDGTGPDRKGPQTGRGTGNCPEKPSDKKPLPKDQGTGRRDGTGKGQGSGRKDGTGRGQGRNQ